MHMDDEKETTLLNSDYEVVFNYKRRTRCWCCFSILLLLIALSLAIALGTLSKKACDKKSTTSSMPSASWLRVAMISDVHLDIQYNDLATGQISKHVPYPCHNASYPAPFSAKFGRANCDAPQDLLESALDEIATAEDADLLLVTGDKTAHFLYESVDGVNYNGTLVYAGQQKFAETLAKKSSRLVILTMGNNDVPFHWQIPPSWWYEKLWVAWSPLILCHHCKESRYSNEQKVAEAEFNSTFLRGGYYKVQVTNGMDFLILNSLYWSSKAWSETLWQPENEVIAEEQMQWLVSNLKAAQTNGRKVVLVGHVPPGLDSHRHQLDNKKYEATQFWFSNFTDRYLNYLTEFSSVLSAQLYAHIHKDDFRALATSKEDTNLPMLLTPAISPIYWNNPAFRYIYFEPKSWQLADYTQYWADFTEGNRLQKLQWKKDYVFSQAYPSSSDSTITGQRLLAIWKEIVNYNETIWSTYMSHRQVHFPNDQDSFSRDHLFCVAQMVNLTAYNTCRQIYPYGPAS